MKRLGEQTPLRIDEAQSSTDSDAGVLDGFEHGIDLSGKAANEFGLVATVDVEPVVRLDHGVVIDTAARGLKSACCRSSSFPGERRHRPSPRNRTSDWRRDSPRRTPT